uniref:Microtubule-associated protein n=1 Tax=Elaeophora elaphi TaxID=1147741 RepID=A0A0R3S163_9BILA
MGDAVRYAAMNRSTYMGSARKDNAEEVAKRRAAIQQEIEQRQKLARRLQDEKMARALAQKEGHLLKQREVQQREMLRAKAVLDRRTQALAEKEKEKKEAVLAKVHALASRLTTQHKSRPAYAFGSSTPRELEYLTQLTKDQKVYDRKLIPSDRSPAAASGSSSHVTLTPPYDSRNYTRASMTGSLYVARSELKPRHKRTSNCMTQSMMITLKPSKTTKSNQTPVHRQSVARRPVTVTKTAPSTVIEVPVKTKKLVQQHMPLLNGQRPRTVQSKPVNAMFYFRPSETKSDALKAKPVPVPRRVNKAAELKTNNEVSTEAILGKSPGDEMSETLVILEKDNIKVQIDVATTEAKNVVNTKEVVNLVPDINETRNLDGECIVEEVSDEKERTETVDDASEVVGGNMRKDDDGMKEKITAGSIPDCIKEATDAEDAVLLDLPSEKNSVNEAKTEDAVVALVGMVHDQEAGMREKQEKESNILKEAQVGLQGMKMLEGDHGDPLTISPDLSQTKLVDEEQGNREITTRVSSVQAESLITNEKLPEAGGDSKQELVIQKSCEVAENKKEGDISAFEINRNFAKEKIELSAQSNSTLKADGIETVAEELKLTEKKNSVEEKRRIQAKLLEREQREREMRRAKLASIMSRTRGGAPSVAVFPPAIETPKHRTGVPVSNEYTPMKSALSHTTASVLQKLATTNPKLLSVLQRNGTNQSLADELSDADPSMSITLPGQPVESIASHEGSSGVRHLPFEPDVNHRPVAMK